LIDTKHAVSSAYQLINVPMGVWIDEQGKIVRSPEPAWTANQTLKIGDKAIVTEGEPYLAALRDWVANGQRSRFALSDEEFARRVKPQSAQQREADAAFKLAVYFHEQSKPELAAKFWKRAQELNPDSWNYHRQDWSFTPNEAGKKWLEKFQKLDQPYYPKLELEKK
jgi:ribosomal protein L11 methylase PrmA